jgi:hypothetical protein
MTDLQLHRPAYSLGGDAVLEALRGSASGLSSPEA